MGVTGPDLAQFHSAISHELVGIYRVPVSSGFKMQVAAGGARDDEVETYVAQTARPKRSDGHRPSPLKSGAW